MFGSGVARGICFFVFVLAAFGVSASALADANSAATSTSAPDRGQDYTQDRVNVAAIDPQQPAVHLPASIEPFGFDTTPVLGGALLATWSGVQADIRADREILARCRTSAELCPSVAKKFLAIITEGRSRSGRARIGVINRAINLAIRPMSDPYRWRPPLNALSMGAGDCKDYAIAKYVALMEAGIAEDDVRFIIVRNLAAGEDHAVVAVRLDGGWIMLDNRWLALVEDIEMPRVVPLFVLDQEGVKQFAPTTMQNARASAPREAAALAPTSLGPGFPR